MKYLDDFTSLRQRIDTGNIKSILFPEEWKEWTQLSKETIDQRLKRICSMPLDGEDFTVVYSLYSRLKWIDVLKACAPSKGAVVLEVGSGSSTIIPNAMTVYDPGSKYITANMNKILTEELKKNISKLPIQFEIIEDDANYINNYLSTSSIDLIVFEHSANDVLQAILCGKKGIDTIQNDWFELLPRMIELINREYLEHTLEINLKTEFVQLISNCLAVLKPGGYLTISHYMFQYDLNLGYDSELWQDIVPVIRPWFKELSQGEEVLIEGFDPQWWLFYQKK